MGGCAGLSRVHTPMRVARHRYWIGGGALLAVLALAIALAWQRPHPAPPAPVAPPAAEEVALPVPREAQVEEARAGEYVGSRTCRACHPEATAAHAVTPHARSLRRASLAADGALFRLPEALHDPTTGGTHRPVLKDSRLAVEARRGTDTMVAELNIAMGSGESGISYLGIGRDGTCLMPRIQVYTSGGQKRWGWTPAMAPEDPPAPTPLGAVLPAEEFHRCFGCHSTVLAMREGRMLLEKSRLGIQCERCHGPARRHLEVLKRDARAVKAGTLAPGIPRLGTLSARQKISLCESCHRPLDSMPRETVPRDLARLQPVALRLSACFIQSGEKLQCMDCHDPHRRVSRQAGGYERVCTSCHATRAAGAAHERGRACTLGRTSGCVGCHMGKEQFSVFGNAVYTNHWIRKRPEPVYRE